MTDEIGDGQSRIDALRSQIASRRYREELGGVEYNGIRWHGDSDGRQAVLEAISAAEMYEAEHGPDTWSTAWKGLDGWLDTCTLEDLRQAGQKLAARRAACFARERELATKLDADGDLDETEIGTGWPA